MRKISTIATALVLAVSLTLAILILQLFGKGAQRETQCFKMESLCCLWISSVGFLMLKKWQQQKIIPLN